MAADKAVPAWRSEPTPSVEPGNLVILREGNGAAQGQPSYLVQPDTAYEVVSAKSRPPLGWLLVSGLAKVIQLMVASFAGVMIYVAVWAPGTPFAGATAPKQSVAAMQPASLVEAMQAARAEMARAMNEAAKIAPAPFFQRPTSYGIYAIRALSEKNESGGISLRARIRFKNRTGR